MLYLDSRSFATGRECEIQNTRCPTAEPYQDRVVTICCSQQMLCGQWQQEPASPLLRPPAMVPPEIWQMMQQAPLAAVGRTLQAAAAAESLSDRESPDAGNYFHLAPIETRSSSMHAPAAAGGTAQVQTVALLVHGVALRDSRPCDEINGAHRCAKRLALSPSADAPPEAPGHFCGASASWGSCCRHAPYAVGKASPSIDVLKGPPLSCSTVFHCEGDRHICV